MYSSIDDSINIEETQYGLGMVAAGKFDQRRIGDESKEFV